MEDREASPERKSKSPQRADGNECDLCGMRKGSGEFQERACPSCIRVVQALHVYNPDRKRTIRDLNALLDLHQPLTPTGFWRTVAVILLDRLTYTELMGTEHADVGRGDSVVCDVCLDEMALRVYTPYPTTCSECVSGIRALGKSLPFDRPRASRVGLKLVEYGFDLANSAERCRVLAEELTAYENRRIEEGKASLNAQ